MNLKTVCENENEMISLLEKLVNIESGSYNKEGIDQLGEILRKEYEQLGFETEIIKEENYGNNLIIKHKDAVNPELIVVAHLDTVFPEGTVKKRPFSIQDGRAYGPGVIDMKASQVSLLYAIKALVREGDQSFKNIEIILNSDEEIGSPSSKELIRERARGKKYAFIMEPARKDGSFVTKRRGGGRFTLEVEGIAAHSGIEPEKGKSAIEELAHKIIKLHELTDHNNGVALNMGLIEGGVSVNTISPTAKGHLDVRISEVEQEENITKAIKDICSQPHLPDTSVKLSGGINRPPFVKTEANKVFLNIIAEAGTEMGIEVKDTSTGGGSDASFTAMEGVATIDGFGPVGGNPHSENEYLEIPTLFERCVLLAKTIQKVSK